MRIGFDAKRIFHNRTGLGNYGRDVIRILSDHLPDYDLVLYNTKPPKANQYEEYQSMNVVYPQSWFWKKFNMLWRLMGVSRQIRDSHLDVYHGLSGEIPMRLGKQTVKKVVTIHDLIFLSHPHYYKWFDRIIYTFKHRYAVRRADKVIAISEQTKRDLVHFLNVDPSKIQVIYQGCNNRFKQQLPAEKIDAARTKYKLPQEYILNVGTIQERKNVLSLIKAIKSTSYSLVLVGSPKSYFRKVQDFIRKNNMEDRITILSNIAVDELVAIYQGAALFCYPSICEGFGIPIIEALYSGIPVITSTGSCFSEAGGPSATYIDPGDIDALREAIITLMRDQDKRSKAIEEGRAFVQKFSDSQVAAHLHRFYQELNL